MIPHYYDATRVVRIMGDDGEIKSEVINQVTEVQADGTEVLLNDMSAGKYDVTVSSGPAYNTMRQESADAMIEMARANPNVWQTHGDLIVAAQDWPDAEEFAKRTKLIMPPELRKLIDEDKEQNPEVLAIKNQAQQMLDQAQQQIQAAESGIAQRDQALQDLQRQLKDKGEEYEAKMAEIQVKAYDAETKRITAMAPAVDPQLLMQVAQQAALTALQSILPQP
jgi:hypothetical protein